MKKTKVIKYQEIEWYKIIKPEKKELNQLQKKFNFHPLDIEDCLEKVQRPKLDIYRSYLFFVLHLPQWDKEEKKVKTIEFKVFLGHKFLITLSYQPIPLLDKLFYQAKQNYRKKKIFFKNSSFHLFYFILNQLFINILPIIKQIGRIINKTDKQLLKGEYKKTLKQISNMRQNLILFQTIIKPQIPIFRKLEKGKAKITQGKYPYYWGNLVDRLRSLWEDLDDYLQILEGLSKTNESLLSYRTNETMKILTIFSVILLPLSLIAGIYGMNIKTLPFLYSPFSFFIISAIMTGIAILMLVFFKAKNWL